MSEPSPPGSPGEQPAAPAAPASPAAPPNMGTEPFTISTAGASAAGAARASSFRITAVVVIALAAGLIAWLVLRDNGNSNSTAGASAAATAVKPAQIKALAASVAHPVFWLGPKAGVTYELIRTSYGSIFIRYLPQGVKVGAKEPYLTVATYPFPGAYAAIQAVAQKESVKTIDLARNGLAETPKPSSTSVHAAYPGIDYQVEVYDPTPGTAEALVAAGQLAALGSLKAPAASSQEPTAASPADLKALAASLGHPIYWAGARKGFTNELVRTADGQVLIRYLPAGTQPGASGAYLTVGTYPYPGALAAIQGLAKGPNAVAIKLSGGGLAVIDKSKPTNIHLAYPGSDYQVEVYDPSAAAAKRVVTAGQVKSVG